MLSNYIIFLIAFLPMNVEHLNCTLTCENHANDVYIRRKYRVTSSGLACFEKERNLFLSPESGLFHICHHWS